MAKTFEETMSVLAALEDGQEHMDAVKARVTKVNQEAAGLRTRLHTAETKLNKVFELTGLTQEDDETVIEQKLKAGKPTNPDESTALKKRIEQLEKDKMEAIQKNQKSEITSKLLDALAKNSVLDNWKNVTKDVLALRVKHNATGQIVYVGDDGSEIDFEEGVTGYIKSNPALVANTQSTGGGAKPPSGGTQTKTIKQSDLDKLPFAEKHKLVSVDKVEIIEG